MCTYYSSFKLILNSDTIGEIYYMASDRSNKWIRQQKQWKLDYSYIKWQLQAKSERKEVNFEKKKQKKKKDKNQKTQIKTRERKNEQ